MVILKRFVGTRKRTSQRKNLLKGIEVKANDFCK